MLANTLSMKAADFQLVKIAFIEIMRGGNYTFTEIADAVKKKYGYSRSWTWRELKELVEKGAIKRKRMGRAYRYSVAD